MKPNVLLIMADQMNPFYTPPYGGSAVMPNLEGLAARGVVFSDASCNSPLCSPSRASMMSGLLVSSLGCAFDNASEFSSEIPTLAHLFRSEGYHTVLSGKMHFIGADQLHGFEERLTTDIYPADFSWTPERWDSADPSHAYYREILRNGGSCVWNTQIQYDEEVHFRSKEKLHELAALERPFFMTVSYTHPHSPFQMMERFRKIYENT
jgi:choline-sulfatase